MKIRAILLLLMIGWDASLHVVKLIGKVAVHPLYPVFPLFGFVSYNIFWAIYWCFAFVIMLTLLGSGTTIKNKTEVHNYPPEKKFKTYEGENITKDTKVVILDDNPLSMSCYAEEYPENWKSICESIDKEIDKKSDNKGDTEKIPKIPEVKDNAT